MADTDPTDAPPPDGGSSRTAWTIVAVLAAALVAFAYAAGTGRSSVAESRAREQDDDRRPRVPVGLPLTDPTETAVATRPVVPPDPREQPDDLQSWVAKRLAENAKRSRKLANDVRELARSFCASASTTPQKGLAEYAWAEDLVRERLDDWTTEDDKAEFAYHTEIYKGLLADSDAYTQRVITPAFIESIPWKDLLSDEMATRWSRTRNVPGFGFRLENGVLRLNPPDAGSKLQGVAGILDQPYDDVRHFVLDMEFAVEGTATMYFHVTPPPGSPNSLQSETLDLISGPNGFTPGVKQTLLATYIGSHLDVSFPGSDTTLSDLGGDVRWSKRRRGGIAFVIPAGAHLTITRMRIRELR